MQELVQRMLELEQQATAAIESAEREAARIFEVVGVDSQGSAQPAERERVTADR
jgi:hypothetical protein